MADGTPDGARWNGPLPHTAIALTLGILIDGEWAVVIAEGPNGTPHRWMKAYANQEDLCSDLQAIDVLPPFCADLVRACKPSPEMLTFYGRAWNPKDTLRTFSLSAITPVH